MIATLVLVKLQLRVHAAMVATMLVSMALTRFLGDDACVNYAISWFGVPAVGLVIVSIQVRPCQLDH